MAELFEPTEINGMRLSNRFVRSATWVGLAASEGACTKELNDLMVNLAKGGAGLIITGHAYVRKDGKSSLFQLGADTDDLIPGLQKMTRAIHDFGGNIVLQLGFGGLYLSTTRLEILSSQDIQDIVSAFAQAAARAKEAEFDGAQIFAAHGFLLGQFLSPRYNLRTDAYGGSIENRARPLIKVMQSVRRTVGAGYPVLVKLNCRDFVDNGLTLEDSVRVGIMLEEAGIDALELSGGLLSHLSQGPMRKIGNTEEEAYFEDEARVFKKEIDLPLLLVGGIRSYQVASRLVGDGVADYISMCRPFIREPGLVNRWKVGDLRKATCISCNHCFDSVAKGEGISCLQEKADTQQAFFPEIFELVSSSPPHPPDTFYKVSIGLELWDPNYVPVVKIQIVSNGKVLDTVNPSFPLASEDYRRVGEAVSKLLEKHASRQAKDSPSKAPGEQR